MATKGPKQGDERASLTQSPLDLAVSDFHLPAWPQAHPAVVIQRALRDPRSLTPHEGQQLQRAIGNRAVGQLVTKMARHQPPQDKTTTTGLPDRLKNGIENLSGLPLDKVKVHYNSTEPAQVQALAFTQGTDIHVAPGQEQHLPHEAWHVVQQMQGRVEPTTQAQGVAINDSEGLEHEADVMGANALRMSLPDPAATGPATQATPDGKLNLESAPVQRITPYFAEQKERWAALNTTKGGVEMAGRYITTGFEFDIGIMEKGNPLEGIAHLELLTGYHPDNPVPFVVETDAGNTLELATAPYLLETKENKPFPKPEAVSKAIDETIDVISKMKSKGTVSAAANQIGKGLGVNWKLETLNIVPANLSVRADVSKAKLAVTDNKLLEQIRVVRDDESIKSPQINILTDAAHLENIEDPGKSRLISGPQKQNESKYRKLFDNLIKEMTRALQPLTGDKYKDRSPDTLRSRIANTIIQQAVAAPLQSKLLEYQGEIEKGTLIESRQKAFPIVANLTSFIKDYSNIWLKTDLITYLRGRLEENTEALVEELKEKKATILERIPEIPPAELVKDPYLQKLLEIAIGKRGENLVTVADTVITKMINELVGLRADPGKRPALFVINPNLLGARHDTHLSQKQADAIARKLGYVSGRLHLIEIRANQEEAILAGSTQTRIPSNGRLTTKHSRALAEITDIVNEYLDQQRISQLGTHPFTIEGEVEFNEKIEEIYTDLRKEVSSGNQAAVEIIAIAKNRIDKLIGEVE